MLLNALDEMEGLEILPDGVITTVEAKVTIEVITVVLSVVDFPTGEARTPLLLDLDGPEPLLLLFPDGDTTSVLAVVVGMK